MLTGRQPRRAHRPRRGGASLRLLAAVAGVTCLVLTGCSGGGSSKQTGIATAVLTAGPPGYKSDSSATGAVSTALLSSLTPAPPSDLASLLDEVGVANADVRVWTKGTSFARILAVQLTSAVGATQVISYEASTLRSTPAASLFAVSQPPDAVGFILTGSARKGAGILFCQSVLFPVDTLAYEVDTCSSVRPGYVDEVERLAKAQAALATAWLTRTASLPVSGESFAPPGTATGVGASGG